MSLTDRQAAERAIDQTCDDDTIDTVAPGVPAGTYVITGTSGWTFAAFAIPDGMAPPEPGDAFRLYGGIGHQVYGGDLRGQPCWYKTADERDAEHAAWLEERTREQQATYERDRDELTARYAALPDQLRARVDRFVANCPTAWWPEFGAYELCGLTAAVAIADAAATTPDPAETIAWFAALPAREQAALVPISAQADTGNLHSYALHVAHLLAMPAGTEQDQILEWGHGALVTLVGCEAYGCITPTDVDLRLPDPAQALADTAAIGGDVDADEVASWNGGMGDA